MRAKVSSEKVEKVVKPPQKPVCSINITECRESPCLSETRLSTPMRNEPKIFIAGVAAGMTLPAVTAIPRR